MLQAYVVTHIKQVLNNDPWLRRLYIDRRRLTDDIIAAIVQALSCCHQLEELDLTGKDIQCRGALKLAALLKDPKCALKCLDLSGSLRVIDYMDIIAGGLRQNKSMKKLVLHCINSGGRSNSNKLQALWSVWDNPESRLEDIGLAANGIGDDTVIALFNSLVGKRKLKRLGLELNTFPSARFAWSSTLPSHCIINSGLDPNDCRNRLTAPGWDAISNHLRSPDCVLEELQLGAITDNDTDINAMESIADALAHNQTLNGLYFEDHANAYSTSKVYNNILARVLCNKSSIMDTYNSNHTLTVWQRRLSQSWYSLYSADLGSYLEINKNNSKADAARKKIIKTHFSSGDMVVKPFLEMRTEVFPRVLAWMGKGGTDAAKDSVSDEITLLYRFVRDMPQVFCFVGNSTNVTYAGASNKGKLVHKLPLPPPPPRKRHRLTGGAEYTNRHRHWDILYV